VNDADQLRRLLLERSVRRGDFVLASGQRSSYYIDCRPTTMSAEGQVLIGRLGLAALHAAGWQPRGIGGLTMGADPVAYAVAAASWSSGSPIDAFSVRKEAKSYGAGRLITTGGSAERAISAVVEAGGRVLGVLAVVDREQGGREHLIQLGYKVVSITTTSQLGLVPSVGTAS
jgi:orotate phosphoribosyltransferase